MIAIPNMNKPKSCDECRYKMWTMNETFCNLLDKMLGDEDIRPDCPLIDIVTCGECKYYEESEYIEGDMVCKYHIGHTYYTEADRYCYYGERNSKNNSNQI